MNPTLRDSTDDDVPAIQAIYAHHVRHGTGSFELEPPTVDEMRARRADVLKHGFPYLVAEADGRVIGFAYASFFRTRPAYRFTVEDSVYVADEARGAGVGRRLLVALIARTMRATGWKFDRWLDTVIMQKELGAADREPAQG